MATEKVKLNLKWYICVSAHCIASY